MVTLSPVLRAIILSVSEWFQKGPATKIVSLCVAASFAYGVAAFFFDMPRLPLPGGILIQAGLLSLGIYVYSVLAHHLLWSRVFDDRLARHSGRMEENSVTVLRAITLLHIAMGSILIVAYLGLFDIGGRAWRALAYLGLGDREMYQRQCVRALFFYAVAVLVQNAVVCMWLQLQSWSLALKVAAFALLCPVLDSLLWTGPRLVYHLLNSSSAYHFAPFIAHHFGMISSWRQFLGNLHMELFFPFIWFLGFFVLAKTVVTLVIVRSITRNFSKNIGDAENFGDIGAG